MMGRQRWREWGFQSFKDFKDWQNKETAMSRFKFRVWDGETFYHFDMDDPGRVSLAYLETFLRLPGKEQFTGLVDKYGNEICEGDVIVMPDNTIIAVRWNETEFIPFDTYSRREDGAYDANECEIIGNIHEKNPGELQKGDWENCPNCPNQGFTVRMGGGVHYITRDMAMDACMPEIEGQRVDEIYEEQEQCEFCYTNPRSVFYQENKLWKETK